jgi:hypothetical protein
MSSNIIQQRDILNDHYEKDNYPSKILLITEETKLTLDQVDECKQKSIKDILNLSDKVFLKEQFENNAKPSLEMLIEFANKLKKPYIKIRDWYDAERFINQNNHLDYVQITFLEKQFETYKSPKEYIISLIGKEINKPPSVVKDWFFNRLIKYNTMIGFQRTRVNYDCQQIQTLFKHFQFNMYPNNQDFYLIAKETHLTVKQVKVWFQNKRRIHKQTLSRLILEKKIN